MRFAYCYVHDSTAAEDIMEDTIVTLIMKRKRLDSGDKLHGYLYIIARNKSIDYLMQALPEDSGRLFLLSPL